MSRWLAAALFLAVACSGSSSLGHEQLQSELRALHSLDAEELLLRQAVGEQRVTRRFAREHARYLLQSAHEHVEKLAKASAEPGAEGELARARTMATLLDQRFVALLLELQ